MPDDRHVLLTISWDFNPIRSWSWGLTWTGVILRVRPSSPKLPLTLLQVQAATGCHKEHREDMSLSVHVSGHPLLLLEADTSKHVRNIHGGWNMRLSLQQAVFSAPRALQLQLSSKVTPARQVSLYALTKPSKGPPETRPSVLPGRNHPAGSCIPKTTWISPGIASLIPRH